MGRTVQLKVRYSDFATITRSRSLQAATSTTQQLWNVACELLMNELPDRPVVVRLLGLGVSNLEQKASIQRGLFDTENSDVEHERANKIDKVSDLIRDKFGSLSLRRASTVQHDAQHNSQPRPE